MPKETMSDQVKRDMLQRDKNQRDTLQRNKFGITGRWLLAGAMALSLLAGCAPESGNSGASDEQSEVEGQLISDVQPTGAYEEVIASNGYEPTTTDNIKAAVAAGELDEPTSFLYRTWLFFGYPQVPEEYFGEDFAYDHGFITELQEKFEELPADIQDQIMPFLLRPNDPRSAYTDASVGEHGDTVSESGAEGNADSANTSAENKPNISLASNTGLKRPVIKAETTDPPEKCKTRWLSQEVYPLGFRVWVCDDPDALMGEDPQDTLDFMADILYMYVPQMKEDFGELIPDDPDQQNPFPGSPDLLPGMVTDDLIDIYALPTGWNGPRRENMIDVREWATAIQASPVTANTSSSYIVMSIKHASDQDLVERIIVHELFHVFQRTFNNGIEAGWWTEGTAEWAASYYVRADSRRLHESRLPHIMNTTAPSILLTTLRPQYAAYIWPLFIEQQRGKTVIADSWRDLASLPYGVNDAELIEVLDTRFNMAENYPELAVRLVNEQLSGDPIAPRFQALDSNFPTSMQPKMTSHTLTKEENLELDAKHILGLGFRDYRVTVEPPPNHPEDTGVLVRVTGSANTSSGLRPDLQGLVRDVDGDYERVPIFYTGDGDTICVDEDMILVLANTSTVVYDMTEGILQLEILEGQPCTTVEVNDPNYLMELYKGDRVEIDGEEGDDRPDKTDLILTVRDPDPEAINEYKVKVKVSGQTLKQDRNLEWSLNEFEDQGSGVWRHSEPFNFEVDLTDNNRPLTIAARLEREGDAIHKNEPEVELHAKQESKCFVDAEASGVLHHQIYTGGNDWHYKEYQVYHSKYYEPPAKLAVVLFSDDEYEATSLDFNTSIEFEPGKGDVDHLHFSAREFGKEVPEGATGQFELKADLTYYDYKNVPWANLPKGEPLPNQGRGQPTPAQVQSILRGTVTIDITKNLPSASILEGTITGVFTDAESYNVGDAIELNLEFATVGPGQC